MSGVAVIWYLLAHNSPLLAQIPIGRIKSGDLPINIVLPAITVTQVGSSVRRTLAMIESPRMHADRVQVTWMCKDQQGYPAGADYPGLVSIGRLVLAACPNQRGTVNGIDLDSILPEDEGPDLPIPEMSIVSRSRDFIVRFNL